MVFKREAIGRAALALAVFFCLVSVAAGAKNYTIYKDDHTMGNPKAPVVMIEYGAPSCPHCAHFDMTVLPLVKKHYIDTGKVFYVFRIFPLMPADGVIAAMAKSLPEDRFFQFLDLAFRHQQLWDPEYEVIDVQAGLVALGKLAGMSKQDVDRCMLDTEVWKHVNEVARAGDKKYHIEGVPFFVINGHIVHAEEADWPDMRKRLDALLAKGR